MGTQAIIAPTPVARAIPSWAVYAVLRQGQQNCVLFPNPAVTKPTSLKHVERLLLSLLTKMTLSTKANLSGDDFK